MKTTIEPIVGDKKTYWNLENAYFKIQNSAIKALTLPENKHTISFG